MAKIGFSNKIEEGIFDVFERLSVESRRSKGILLETAIEALAALRPEIQDILTSGRQKDRTMVFDLLRGLQVPQERDAADPESARRV